MQRRRDDDVFDFVKFLYLNGPMLNGKWGKNDMTNAAILQRDTRDYFRRFFLSEYYFAVEGNHIRDVFYGVEGMDEAVIERMLEARKETGELQSWEQVQNLFDLKPADVENLAKPSSKRKCH